MFQSCFTVIYEIFKNEKYFARGTALIYDDKYLIDAGDIPNGDYVFRFNGKDYNIKVKSGHIKHV